jgi:hypothetical protein
MPEGENRVRFHRDVVAPADSAIAVEIEMCADVIVTSIGNRARPG